MYKNMFNTKALSIAMSMAFVSTSVIAVEVGNHAGAICNNAIGSNLLLNKVPIPNINAIYNYINIILYNFINTSDALYINHSPNGTSSKKTTRVTCPLVRKTISTFGATMKVDISNNNPITTVCTAISYNPDGTIIASNSAPATGTGHLTLFLNLYGSGNSTPLSYYSVYCSIPANSSTIRGIRLCEYDTTETDPFPSDLCPIRP